MELHPGIVFLGGLVVIILGAEMLLRGAARFAALLGVKPLLVGMTVVAVGTSTPELAVGITAVVEGRGPLAVGNIAGTNIFNILFILGLSAAIRPLALELSSIKLDVPVMIASAIGLFLMAADGLLSRLDGLVLLGGAFAYLLALLRVSRSENATVRREFAAEYSKRALAAGGGALGIGWNALLLVVGIALTILGADLMVAGAVNFARVLGVTDAIIGLTIVAIGTSAPELATTVVATVKNERDVAVGNLIGSSISNILVILGLTCVAVPSGIEVSRDVILIDLPLAAAVAVACYPTFRSDHTVSRREGAAFVTAYFAYLATVALVRA